MPKSKNLIKIISSTIFEIAGKIIAYIANLGFPSALITGLPIMANAKKGTPNNTTLKYSVAGSKIAPLAPNNKSSGL